MDERIVQLYDEFIEFVKLGKYSNAKEIGQKLLIVEDIKEGEIFVELLVEDCT